MTNWIKLTAPNGRKIAMHIPSGVILSETDGTDEDHFLRRGCRPPKTKISRPAIQYVTEPLEDVMEIFDGRRKAED